MIDRLVKLCGMLGSAHEGERAAAALKADQLLRSYGLRWADVIAVSVGAPDPPAGLWVDPKRKDAAAYLLATWPDLMTDWETAFCRTLIAQDGYSRKQSIILSTLLKKVRRKAGGDG